MKRVLLTGVTGFVGSSLAANFLRQNCEIIALSRADPSGERTINAIRDAAEGFGFALNDDQLKRIKVIAIDFDNISALAAHPDFKTIDEIWHSAAEMTYNPQKLDRAIKQNLSASYKLYQTAALHSSCRRFYYVSTAYTAGLDKRVAMEELHLDPTLVNVYQSSKWSAEMSLAHASQRHELPVTIFRPSVVVGHQQTGWHGKSKFGFYSFVGAIHFAKTMKSHDIKLNINPDAQVNLIPIDVLCSYAMGLSARDESACQSLEVFHATAKTAFSNQQLSGPTGQAVGINVEIAKPDCTLSRLIDEKVQLNIAFAKNSWEFDMGRIESALGKDYKPFHMSDTIIKSLIGTYVQNSSSQIKSRKLSEKMMMTYLKMQVMRKNYAKKK